MLGPSYIGHRSGYVTVDRAPMLVTASGMATHKAGTLEVGSKAADLSGSLRSPAQYWVGMSHWDRLMGLYRHSPQGGTLSLEYCFSERNPSEFALRTRFVAPALTRTQVTHHIRDSKGFSHGAQPRSSTFENVT